MIKDYRTALGLLLILAGGLLALQQFGILGGQWDDAVFTGIFALGVYFFANLYRQNRAQWWFGFVAVVLAGLTLSNLLDIFFPAIGGAIGGGIFLGMIGIGFLFVYFRDRTNWWAVIPAGVMFSLAAVAVVDDLPGTLPFDASGLLFVGMGLTFFILSFIKVGAERLSWGIFPAIALIAFGLFVGLGEAAAWNYIWPGMIIVFGIYFLITSLRRA